MLDVTAYTTTVPPPHSPSPASRSGCSSRPVPPPAGSCTLMRNVPAFSYTLNLRGCVPPELGISLRSTCTAQHNLKAAFQADDQTNRTSMRWAILLKPLSRVSRGAFKCLAVAAITASGSLSLYVRLIQAE